MTTKPSSPPASGLATGVTLGVLALAATSCGNGGGSAADGAALDGIGESVAGRLEVTFDEIRRAWNPRVKVRIVDAARPARAEFEQPLLAILAQPTHVRLGDAIYLASQLGIADARPLLVELSTTAPEQYRPAAILAAARLGPWPAEDLIGFLDEDDPAIRAAALGLAAPARGEVLSRIFALLGDPDETVRDAALAAVPRRLTDAQRDELIEITRYAEDEHEVRGIRALARAGVGPVTERLLLEKLIGLHRAARIAALQALAGKGEPLTEPGAVWDLATVLAEDPVEQAVALSCLERTRSFDAGDLLRQIPAIKDPVCRFYAARCLIRAGEKQGAAILVELLEDQVEGFEDLWESDPLAVAVQRTLQQLPGLDPDGKPDEWREWLARLEDLPATALDESDLELAARDRPMAAAPPAGR